MPRERAPAQYQEQNEQRYRQQVDEELAQKHDRRSNLVLGRGKSLVLASPSGIAYSLSLDDDGILTVTDVATGDVATIVLDFDAIGGELDADRINFGAQTSFDLTTETFITEVGSVRSRYGTAFGSGASVVMWHGPTSVAQGSESRTNGYLAIGTDGLIYHNAAALSWGATAAEAAASNTWANFGARKGFNFSTTLESVTCSASSTLTWVAGVAQWVTAATDQNVFTTLNLAGRLIPKIRMRVRPTSASFSWEGVVYYNTSGHAYSGSFYKAIGSPTGLAQNDWVIAEWDMTSLSAGGTDWIDNTIISVRFDISNGSGETWEIDWIAFGDFGPDPVGIRGIEDDADPTIDNTAAAITGQGVFALGNYYEQSTDPGSVANGSFWFKTTTNELFVRRSAAWGKVATIANQNLTITRTNGFVKTRIGSGTITSDSVSFSSSGGSGTGYTYAHELFATYTTGPSPTISSASGSPITASASGAVPGDEVRGFIQTTATDSEGNRSTLTSPLALFCEI